MYFDKPYNRPEFIRLIESKIFPTFKRMERPLEFWKSTAYFVDKWITQLWIVELDQKIYVLEIEQKSSNDPRITLTKDAFKILEYHWIDHAVVIFHCKDTDSYRLSLLTITYENREKRMSSYKRYSYILWPSEKVRTPNQQIIDKWSIKDFDDLISRFDVEVVRKEFFETYLELFVRLYKEIIIDKPFSDLLLSQNVDLVSFTKNLLWKIIFLYFIQQKWWLWLGKNTTTKYGEWNKDFMRKLWINFKQQWESLCTHEKTWYFYNDYLEWLFYAWLNVDRRKDDDRFEQLQMKVPYLNGWLFREEYEWRKNNISKISNDIFSNVDKNGDNADWILDIFDRYNFTIDEDSLYDTDIAVDPEMLWRIFEKMISISSKNIDDVLKLYDNKKKNAKFDFWKDLNKKLWAFYTPREIVHYMTRESLASYLHNKAGVSIDNINIIFDLKEKFLLNSTDMKKAEYSTEKLMEIWNSIIDIDEALKSVKILDPAVGSWAFPMWLLHEISSLRYYIYKVFNKILKDKLEKYLDKNNEISLYKIKREIILNNIHWVDIDPGAIDIAKLRFRLSLVVDEEEPEPLPNFEFKFISADSLIPLEEWSLFTKADVIEKLKNLRDEYYKCDDKDEKDKLKNKFYDIKRELTWFWKSRTDFSSKKEWNEYLIQSYNANADLRNRQILEWDPFETKEYTKRSDTELMMWQDKFDIIIGNPPYISAVDMARSESEKLIYKKFYPQATWAFDIYVLFLLLWIKKSDSIYTWIIPNKFLIADYAKKTFEHLKEFWLKYSIDVSSFNVFKTASVYPIIIFGNKGEDSEFKEYLLENYSDLLLKNFSERTHLKIDSTINSIWLKTCAWATGFEAQKLKSFVTEIESDNTIPFTVSWNIDRYEFNNINVKYMKWKYSRAFIKKDKSIADSKIQMWENKKIIIAWMTKKIEATYVDWPLAIWVWSYAIYDFNWFSPYYILWILNSKYESYYLKSEFKDKHLAWWYLAINKTTIDALPFPDTDQENQDRIIDLVKKILTHKKDWLDTIDLENKIDQIVYEIYWLTAEQIQTIEDSFK